MRPSSENEAVPDGWQLVCLGDVAEIVMGQSPPGATVFDWNGGSTVSRGLPFIQGNAEFGPNSPKPLKWCAQPTKVARIDDILISVRAPVGETNRADTKIGIGRGLAAIRFAVADARAFGWHALNHAKGALEAVTQGSTFKAIGGHDLRSLPILLPPLSEQQAIAAVLDSIDEAIECTDSVIAATEHLRDSLLHELLTRGVPGWHTEWQEAPAVGTIPADWKVVRLGEVAEVNPRRPRLEMNGDTLVDFIPMAAVGEHLRGIQAALLRPYNEVSNGYTYFENRDVLLAKITPCLQNGKHTLVDGLRNGFGFGTTEFHVLRAGKTLEPHHLFRTITQHRYIRECEDSFTGTAGQQRVQPDTIRQLIIPIPSLPEQQAIAAVLDGAEEATKRARIEEGSLQSLKASAADALLTGQVRLIEGSAKERSRQ